MDKRWEGNRQVLWIKLTIPPSISYPYMTGTPNHFCRSNTYSTKSSFWGSLGIVGVPQKDRTYFQDGSSMMVFFPHHLQVKTCPCGQVHAWGGECREQLCSAIAGDLGDTIWGSPWTQTLQLCTLLKWFSKTLCFCRYVFVLVFVWFSSNFSYLLGGYWGIHVS
jgi:hypothetical protein